MTAWTEQRIRVPDHVMVREVNGESVLLDTASLNFFGLDDVGTRMWAVLAGASSLQEACEALLTEYDVAPDVLQRDLQESWREEAERKLAGLTSEQRLWLVDVTLVEHTWPGLERAGRCREHSSWEGLRLLLCGLSAPAEPPGP